MKRRGLIAALAAAGVLAGATGAVAMTRAGADAEFLPLTVGSQWSYVGSDGHQVSETVRGTVEIPTDAGGKVTAAAIAAADGSEYFYLPTAAGVVKIYDAPSQLPSAERATWVLRFPLHLNSHWESWTPSGKVEFRVTDRRSIAAPDGSLTDGVRVDFTSLPEPIFSGHIWYARGIGPTEIDEGDYSRKLLGYKAGEGAAIPLAPRLEGLEPPRMAEKWVFGRKGWVALGLTLVMLIGLTMIPRLARRPPKPGKWESRHEPPPESLVEDEGLLPVQAARLEASIAKHPRYADLRCKLGGVYLAMERWDDSTAQYREALVLNPHYVEAALGLTRALKNAGRASEARDVIKPFAEKHPTYADVQNLYGEALAEAGDVAAAADRFRAALAINPRFELASKNLARWTSSSPSAKDGAHHA